MYSDLQFLNRNSLKLKNIVFANHWSRLWWWWWWPWWFLGNSMTKAQVIPCLKVMVIFQLSCRHIDEYRHNHIKIIVFPKSLSFEKIDLKYATVGSGLRTVFFGSKCWSNLISSDRKHFFWIWIAVSLKPNIFKNNFQRNRLVVRKTNTFFRGIMQQKGEIFYNWVEVFYDQCQQLKSRFPFG